MPRVTIITATYNWATVLPYSVASALDQTFGDFEHWVIGDGCTDESAEVMADLAARDPRVRWFNLAANTGHQWGPNAEGLARAEGDLIAYLGHDDLWLPNHLDVLVAAADADPAVGLVHSTTLMVYPDRVPYVRPGAGWIYQPPDWIPPTSVIHRRDVAAAAGGWKPPSADGRSDPEAEVWAAIAARAGTQWVPRTTVVKLPASVRRGVYRDRPTHEQAYWLDRIRAAPDPEADLAAACASPYPLAVASSPRWMTGSERAAWAVRTRLRRLVGRTPVTAAERHRLRRRFKGLDS
jgi:glycosyltransferase involved in cell wall biosynthesis